MKYTKGTKLMADKEAVYYVDEFRDDDDNLILVCGGGGCGHFQYIPEDEVVAIETTNEEKVLDVLVSISSTMVTLNQNIEEMQSALFDQEPCNCEGCNDECSSCEPPDDLNIN